MDYSPRLDVIAEAMADADDGIIFGLLTPDEAEFYRRMAQAAIDTLQLTQEWKTVHESGGGQIHRTYAEAAHRFDTFVERPPGVEDPGSGVLTHIAERLVSPWVEDA